MKKLLTINLTIIACFYMCFVNGQTSLKKINLKNGKYDVGFQNYIKKDSTRLYRVHNEFNNQHIFRPISISIWYPSKVKKSIAKPLTVLNYLEILKEEEEWKYLPNEFLLDWFSYLWNTPENRAHLSEKTTAFYDVPFLEGKYPVIVYAPSYQASSIENFALCEYIASHGFVVISSSSRGTNTRKLEGGAAKDMETQSRDVEFLLKEIYNYKYIDTDKIALMGFSFGGLSNAITVMKNHGVKALVSLDGTERYRYNVLEKSPYFNLESFSIPYVHFAQKEIPKKVLVADKIPEELNYKFDLYDSLRHSDIYRYRFHDLSHSYFITYGVLFGNRDKRQDKSDAKIMQSYSILCNHTLQFLEATLKNKKKAHLFIENTPSKNGFQETIVSKQMKKSNPKAFDYKDFNDLAFQQEYRDLISLFQKTKRKYPKLKLQEGMLNTLGLQLSFNPNTIEQGIHVFLLALHIYPNSANLYDSLAEAYLYKKDFKNAIKSFKKSLELNPENENAINKLKILQ